MKRLSVMAAVASALLVGGCGLRDYNSRTDRYYDELKEVQAQDALLEKPQEGKYKELSVFLRVPKKASESGSPLSLPAGAFDEAGLFTCTPEAPPAKNDGSTAPAPLPPLKLYVLVRKKPTQAAAKKGEPPPPPPNTANRGEFVADVKQALAPEFGQEIAEKAPQKGAGHSSLKVTATSGDDVRVYFFDANKGELQTALAFDVPPALRNDKIVTKGIEYCLKTFKMGRDARNAFNGKTSGAAKPGGEGF